MQTAQRRRFLLLSRAAPRAATSHPGARRGAPCRASRSCAALATALLAAGCTPHPDTEPAFLFGSNRPLPEIVRAVEQAAGREDCTVTESSDHGSREGSNDGYVKFRCTAVCLLGSDATIVTVVTIHSSESSGAGGWHMVVTPPIGMPGYRCLDDKLHKIMKRAEESVGLESTPGSSASSGADSSPE